MMLKFACHHGISISSMFKTKVNKINFTYNMVLVPGVLIRIRSNFKINYNIDAAMRPFVNFQLMISPRKTLLARKIKQYYKIHIHAQHI